MIVQLEIKLTKANKSTVESWLFCDNGKQSWEDAFSFFLAMIIKGGYEKNPEVIRAKEAKESKASVSRIRTARWHDICKEPLPRFYPASGELSSRIGDIVHASETTKAKAVKQKTRSEKPKRKSPVSGKKAKD